MPCTIFRPTHPYRVRQSTQHGNLCIDFYPRAHMGRDAGYHIRLYYVGLFRPTRPHGARLLEQLNNSPLSYLDPRAHTGYDLSILTRQRSFDI